MKEEQFNIVCFWPTLDELGWYIFVIATLTCIQQMLKNLFKIWIFTKHKPSIIKSILSTINFIDWHHLICLSKLQSHNKCVVISNKPHFNILSLVKGSWSISKAKYLNEVEIWKTNMICKLLEAYREHSIRFFFIWTQIYSLPSLDRAQT